MPGEKETMEGHLICPRCGSRDSFMKGFLPETCVCRVCQSQLDYREIPNCGPDCEIRREEAAVETAPADATDAVVPDGPVTSGSEGVTRSGGPAEPGASPEPDAPAEPGASGSPAGE